MSNDESVIIPQLKGKLWYHIEKILQDVESGQPNKVTHSKKYTNAMVEVVLARLTELTNDLECFAKHDSGRADKVITMKDLELYLRNSPYLQETLLDKKM